MKQKWDRIKEMMMMTFKGKRLDLTHLLSSIMISYMILYNTYTYRGIIRSPWANIIYPSIHPLM